MSTYPEGQGPRRRGRGRPPKISRDAIVDAAVELGIDRFSMQAVADRLGVTAPALYSHVASRDEVVALAAATVRDRLGDFRSDAEDWRGWLGDFATNVRAALGATSSALTVDHRRLDPAELLAGEQGLRLLFDAGFDEVEAAYAVWLTYRVAVTAGPERSPSFDRFVSETGALLGGGHLDDDVPATGAVQRALATGGHDTFAFDLEVVLDGIAARLARRDPHPPTSPRSPRARGARR